MTKKFLKVAVPVIIILALSLAACAPKATPTPEPTQAPTEAPTAVVTEAPKPSVDPTGQKVAFWHVWGTGLPNETMLAIVDDFNKTNKWGITVEAVDQGKYANLEDAFNAAIQSGDLPDLVTGYTNAMANWYAVDAVVDLTPYVNDSFFGLTDAEKAAFYQGSLDGGKAPNGTFFAFPISQSANVIYYNSQWAQELGFANPPTNYEEFKAQACAAVDANNKDANKDNDGTGGFVLNTGASNVASFVFANGGTMLTADRTGYNFTDQTVVDVATLWKDMWDAKCAFMTESYPNPEFASRKALFVMSSTAGLPYQVAAFDAEGAIKDKWTLIPFPGKDGGKAVDLYGQYVAIAKTSPERMMATWVFLKYLTSPEVQAKWIQGSAYYPTRSDTLPLLTDYAAKNPIWGIGLDLVQYGSAEPAWPSWTSVRRTVGDTFSAIIQGTPADIPTLLADLDAKAAQAIVETQK
jgi:multiple sugar transport system substrate-binding protein/sn-glycerol 3-phosphate transport system substrate-binding protein